MSRQAFVWIPVIGLAFAGCGDGVGLEDAQVLALVEVAGLPVPAEFDEGTGTSRIFVADTIWLLPDATWRRNQVERRVNHDGTEDDVGFASDGFVRLDGDETVLDFECNDVVINPNAAAVCVAPDRLVQRDDGWEIARELFPGALVLSYRILTHN